MSAFSSVILLPLRQVVHQKCVGLTLGRLKQEVEVKQHSLKLLQQRISGSESAQLAEAVAATQAELDQAKAAAEAAKQKKADMIKIAKVDCTNDD